ncbi:MAG: exo-alpha-sialidase [Mycobacteriales bacterium]
MNSRSTKPRQNNAKSRTGGAARGGSSAAIGVSVVVAVLAIGVLFFLARGDSDTDTAAPAGMAHVHGLAVDPANGELLAGTHFGAFRIAEDGSVEQFGPTQDFMGFSVAGPGHYLASGHPGAGQGGPGNLGLIESTDGGQTWETVSLEGKADFHTLEARHGRVYGHSGGQLMVSEDKKTWDERASIPLADLAVSPDDADTILVTTQQGLGASNDGGRSFQVVPDTPILALLAWTEDGMLVGVDPNGGVQVSADGGRTWDLRGTAGGQPAAVTADGDDVFVATRDGRVVESNDAGRTFGVRYQEA